MDRQRKLTAWFRQWRADLRNFLIARGLAQRSDIDDIAQEVFLRLLRYDRAELVEHPKAYLFRMASNLAAEWAIRSRARHPHESKWLADLATQDPPHEVAVQASAQREVERAINTLSPRQRHVLKLHIEENLSVSQIAARLACTPRMVKRDLARSYGRLRQELDRELIGEFSDGSD